MSTLQDIFSMQDKVCVITGGSRGLGYYMAKGFFAAGAKRVYITARKADACNAAAEELSQYGECISLPGDISTMEEIQSLANTLKERESSIDVLVNNAGRGWLEPLESFPEMGWDKVMDLNVKSPFFLTRELVPLLEEGRLHVQVHSRHLRRYRHPQLRAQQSGHSPDDPQPLCHPGGEKHPRERHRPGAFFHRDDRVRQ